MNLLEQMKQAGDEMAAKFNQAQKPAPPKNVLPDNGLLTSLDEHLESQNTTKEVKKKNFTASDTVDCARRWVYLFQGVEIDNSYPARVWRIFGNGNSFHDRMTSYFQDMGILVEAEREFWNDDPPIKGFIDAIILWDGKEKVVELKSISSNGFEYRAIYNKPKDEHYMQAQVYLGVTELEEAFIIYENKDTQELMLFVVKRDEEFILALWNKWKKIWKQFQAGELPKRPARSPNSKKCTYCEVKSICWKEFNEANKPAILLEDF